MNKERMELWLAALESNEYPQCFGSFIEDTDERRSFCAMGVGLAVYCREVGINLETGFEVERWLCVTAAKWYGIDDLDLRFEPYADNEMGIENLGVMVLNDDFEAPFSTIAQRIRKDYF